MGVVTKDENIFSLCFTDDQVIVAQDKDDAAYMIQTVLEEDTTWGIASKNFFLGGGRLKRYLIIDVSEVEDL